MWNNRVIINKHEYEIGGVAHVEYSASIHEFYYDDDGKILGYTENPVYSGGFGETPDEAYEDLVLSLKLLNESIERIESGHSEKIRHDLGEPSYGSAEAAVAAELSKKILDADDAFMEERYGDEE